MSRLRNYFFLFFLILIPLIVLNDYWKVLDHAVYKIFYLNVPEEDKALKDDIILIDIPKTINDVFDRESFRKRIADLLSTIDSLANKPKNKPKAVVLDIFFSQDKVGLEDLKKSIKQLQQNDIKVYGVFNTEKHEDIAFEKRNNEMDIELYDSIFDGHRLQTMYYPEFDVLSYDSLLYFKKKDGTFELIVSLPFKVAKDFNSRNNNKDTFTKNQTFVLPIGDKKELDDHTYKFTHNPNETSGGKFEGDAGKSLNLENAFLIVGSIGDDYIQSIEKHGPHLLAWALNDQLKEKPIAKQPLNSIFFIMGMVLFFSFFVSLIFALIFKYVKALQTKPGLMAILSLLIGILFLIVIGFAQLSIDDGKIIPVGLTLVSMLVVSLFAWHFGKKFFVLSIIEGSGKYDVFISYSFGDGSWVKKNLYDPLSKFEKPDGSNLNIFFAEKSINIGEQFTIKYMTALANSKVVVPVMSKEYYTKNHCRNEMDMAVKRNIEKLNRLFIIAFGPDCIPDHYNHILFNDITVQKDFITSLQKELV